jgi:hypothetical protein
VTEHDEEGRVDQDTVIVLIKGGVGHRLFSLFGSMGTKLSDHP